MNFLITLLRRRSFQGLWERLHHISLVLMNYWASHLRHSGEADALGQLSASFPPDAVLFDVGANVGEFVELLRAYAKPDAYVHAFEPSTAAFSAMKERMGNDPKLTLNCVALSDREGNRTLHSDAFGSSIGSLESLASPIRPFDSRFDEEVVCTTLDSYCASHAIGQIDFLKIDVEGHELKVLAGAKSMLENGRIHAIQWEFGENNISSRSYLSDFVAMLAGYDLFRVVPGGLSPWSWRDGSSEIFATMNYIAIRADRRDLP